MEYCCHIWAGASCTALKSLDKIQKRLVNLFGPNLLSTRQYLSHRRNVASLALFCRYYHGRCSEDLASLIPKLQMSFCSVPRRLRCSFHKHSGILWNSLPKVCFPADYNLNSFKVLAKQFLKKSFDHTHMSSFSFFSLSYFSFSSCSS